MKSIVYGLVLATLIVATNAFAQDATKADGDKAKVHARRAAQRLEHIAAAGGLVNRPINGKVICIKVETDKVSKELVYGVVEDLQKLLRVAIDVIGKGEESKHTVGAFVLLAEQGDKSPTILCAPEDFWATVNVSRLIADNPADEVFKSRITKELWRAFGFAMGAANSQQQPCVMRPIRRATDLDAQKVCVLTPEALMAIRPTISFLGLAAGGQTTYRKACEEGWAPAPTNDAQKAIWDKVHSLPSAPIKIKPEEKKVTE